MKKSMAQLMYDDPQANAAKPKSILQNSAIMVGILLLTILFTEFLYHMHFGNQSLIMVYMLSVLVISRITPTYVYGIVAAVISTLAYDYFITEPRLGFSFTMGSPITLMTMLTVTGLTSYMTMQVKSQAQLALDREHKAELFNEINQKLLAARDADAIINVANEYLVSHLERPVVFYTHDPLHDQSGPCTKSPDGTCPATFRSEDERKRVHRIFHSRAEDPAEPFEDMIQGVYHVSVVSKGKMLGVIGIDCREGRLSKGSLMFVKVITRLVASALELQYLSDEQSRLTVDAEKEKMRSNLLRSISHDLRTPLTSILGASSAILEQKDMAEDTRLSLAGDIHENAQWLIRMVENILTVTRISKDTMKVTKTMEAAEEIVSQAVSLVRKRFPDCSIHVRIPDQLLMVPMDATLISQVLINLLENAVKNSPEGALILLNLKAQDRFAQFEVRDHGTGIPEQLLDNLFEIHSTVSDQVMDSSRGMGIGLSVCKTIIRAHGGTIEGYNREEGGAKFTFSLPLEEEATLEG